MSKKPLLLIVEDDLLLAETMMKKFSASGFRVQLAPNGYAAIECIKEQIPQVILLDILLPIKNGFDILAEIKQEPLWQKIPVIIASNLDTETDIDKGFALGAGEYIVKSNLSLNDLVQKVSFLMNKSSHGRDFLNKNQ